MDLNPEFLKSLITTFQSELEEGLQVITEGLLWLEKNGIKHRESEQVTEKILRSAHNIKGAARGVGVNDVGDIAHRIESVFLLLQKNKEKPPAGTFDLCFEAVDDMRKAMKSFSDHTPLPFNLTDLLKRMENDRSASPPLPEAASNHAPPSAVYTPVKEQAMGHSASVTLAEQETIRVSLDSLDKVSALLEEMQVSRIAIDDHYLELTQFSNRTHQLTERCKKIFQHCGIYTMKKTIIFPA